MNEPERNTFRGLPLTPEQDSEIRHYIHVRSRSGMEWNTPELQAMIVDMLEPPELADEDSKSLGDSTTMERATANADAGLDPDAQDRDQLH